MFSPSPRTARRFGSVARSLIALGLIGLGLAHSEVAMEAVRGPNPAFQFVFITVLWTLSVLGYAAAAVSLLRWSRYDRRWIPALTVAAFPSITLLLIGGFPYRGFDLLVVDLICLCAPWLRPMRLRPLRIRP